MDDFEKLKGVGKKTLEKLLSGGIKTFNDLATANKDDILALGISEKIAQQAIEEAKKLSSEKSPIKATSKKPDKVTQKHTIPKTSFYEQIPGVGKVTAQKLEKGRFKSVRDLANANIDEITLLGITSNIAKKVIHGAKGMAEDSSTDSEKEKSGKRQEKPEKAEKKLPLKDVQQKATEKIPLETVQGIGKKTAEKLRSKGYKSVEDLVKAHIDEVIAAGIGKKVAEKAISNAMKVPIPRPPLASKSKESPADASDVVPKKPKKKAVAKAEAKVSQQKKAKLTESFQGISGIGKVVENKLKAGGYTTIKEVAEATIQSLVELGIGKKTAENVIKNSQAFLGMDSKPAKSEKTKPKVAKKAKTRPVKRKAETAQEEDFESVFAKRRRGTQTRKIEKKVEKVDKAEEERRSEWIIERRELTPEEIAAREERAKARLDASKITRTAPLPPQPVKAVRKKKKVAHPKPEKKVKEKKKRKMLKKVKEKFDYYSAADIPLSSRKNIKPRGVKGVSGESKPRLELEKDVAVGFVSSHRRSRRNVKNNTLIIKVNSDYNAKSLIGKKVRFSYPESEKEVIGSIYKEFGKKGSNKALARFRKGVTINSKLQVVYTK